MGRDEGERSNTPIPSRTATKDLVNLIGSTVLNSIALNSTAAGAMVLLLWAMSCRHVLADSAVLGAESMYLMHVRACQFGKRH